MEVCSCFKFYLSCEMLRFSVTEYRCRYFLLDLKGITSFAVRRWQLVFEWGYLLLFD